MSAKETAICVTCGEEKPAERFEEGDCTCLDCYVEGRSGVNYPDKTASDECERCGDLLGDHGVMRIDREVAYICPFGLSDGSTDEGDKTDGVER